MVELPDSSGATEEIIADHVEGAPRRARLHLKWSDDKGVHSSIVSSDTTLGSSERADVVIAHASVSRLHMRLETQGSAGFWFRDLESTNGTWIHGFRVREGAVARKGVIQLGAVAIEFSEEARSVPVELWPTDHYRGLIGGSTVMQELYAKIEAIAPSDIPVLISGETGTGKELVAQAIHQASKRADGPFIVVDCTTLLADTADAELFGHCRGAFTDALVDRMGAFEEANGGTVFLDEVGELPLSVQPKLLRVLESMQVRRIGENEYRPIDVRVVCATHRDLSSMVNAGGFREDLYFRLAGARVQVPSLSQRASDLPVLVRSLAGAEPDEAKIEAIVLAATERGASAFAGNVRELRSFVLRSLVLGPTDQVDVASVNEASTSLPAPDTSLPFAEVRALWNEHLEREYLAAMIEIHGRSLRRIAKAAGMARSNLHRLLQRHNL